MPVLSEEKLLTYLELTHGLSGRVLPLISECGTATPPDEIEAAFRRLVEDLSQERENDPALQDACWDWIFQPREDGNLIQLYGRLAWINLQLLELL